MHSGITRELRRTGEAEGGAGFGFGGFFFALLGLGGGFEGLEKADRGGGNLFHGRVECGFVGFGGCVEAGDFTDELKRGGADFVWSDGRIEVEESFDVSAHGTHL